MTLTKKNAEIMVSVIVPIYNAENSIEKAVKSICAQTIDAIQIILVDDASVDNSVKCCEMLRKEDHRIEVYRHENNQGVSATRNTGLSHVKGKYVAFVDGDDYIDKDMLETLIKLISEPKTDLAVCGYYINDMPQIGKKEKHGKMSSLECAKAIAGYHGSLVKGYVVNKLFKKELIDFHQLRFNERVHICEDAIFSQQYVKHCKSINYDSVPKYHYIIRQGSAMHGCVTEKRMSVLRTYPLLMQIGHSYGDQTFDEVLESNYLSHHLSILKDVIRYPSKEQKEYGDQVFPYIKKKCGIALKSKHLVWKRKLLMIGLRIGYPIWVILINMKR